MGIGTLIMASTHIGNLEDTPNRTISALKQSDLLIFEERKPAHALLKQAGIRRPYLLYSEHGQKDALAEVKISLKNSQTVMYCSDQGCPSLADPGSAIVQAALEIGASLKVIPGPSSLTAALSVVPWQFNNFYFAGFPPRKDPERSKWFEKILNKPELLIMMDTPYRLVAVLGQLAKFKRSIGLHLDISGEAEEHLFGQASKLKERFVEKNKRNFVITISPI